MAEVPIPVGFRAETLQQVTRLLRSGESCALIGVGSSGKSNIARHLARPDVRREYFGAEAEQTVVAYLNCKPYAQRPPADLYLHALDQLGRAVDGHDGPLAAEHTALAELWHAAHSQADVLALRNLDLALDRLARAGAGHVILALDDCDDLLASAPGALFSDLRGLRDNHKVCLVYLTLTRREPAFLRTGTPAYEELFELISAPGHTIPVPPYGEADGLLMLTRLAGRQVPPRSLTEAEARRLYALAGGHAGLLRSLFFATHYNPDLAAASMSPNGWERLAEHADVEAECGKIWDSLEPEERASLERLLRHEPVPAEDQRRLERRGLVRPHLNRPAELFSPVFEKNLAAVLGLRLPSDGLSVEFLGAGRQVRVNGNLVTSLLAPELELLRVLAQGQPEPVARVHLIDAMRRGEQTERSDKLHGDPLRRLEEYMRQLKAKLGPAGHHIQPAGEGYKLA